MCRLFLFSHHVVPHAIRSVPEIRSVPDMARIQVPRNQTVSNRLYSVEVPRSHALDGYRVFIGAVVDEGTRVRLWDTIRLELKNVYEQLTCETKVFELTGWQRRHFTRPPSVSPEFPDLDECNPDRDMCLTIHDVLSMNSGDRVKVFVMDPRAGDPDRKEHKTENQEASLAGFCNKWAWYVHREHPRALYSYIHQTRNLTALTMNTRKRLWISNSTLNTSPGTGIPYATA